MNTVFPSGAMPGSMPKLSPWWPLRAQRTKVAWELVTRTPQSWVTAVGQVSARGLLVHGDLVPWPSRLYARLWRRLAVGVDEAHYWRLLSHDPIGTILTETLPWKRLNLDLLLYIDAIDWNTLSDPAVSELARIRWVPWYRRAERNGRHGWQHPSISAIFIPDSDLLTPIIQRIPWDTTQSLGEWLFHAIGQWEQHEASDAWFDQADATHLTTERLMGMQFAMWTSMGLGYFDATEPLDSWLTLWPPTPEWYLRIKEMAGW